MYFRGKRIIDAVINNLEKRNGILTNGTDIVFSGGSAGGLTTILHTNYIVEKYFNNSSNMNIASLVNVGYFIDSNGVDHGESNYSNGMKWIYKNMNVSSSLKNCDYDDNDDENCIFSQNMAGNIKVPTFMFNSQYDAWQVNNILSSTNETYINQFGKNFTNILINNYLEKNNNNGNIFSAFINSCCYHDGDTNEYWYNLKIDQITPAVAFNHFYNAVVANTDVKKNAKRSNYDFFWFQNETYPCSDCCPQPEPQSCHYY